MIETLESFRWGGRDTETKVEETLYPYYYDQRNIQTTLVIENPNTDNLSIPRCLFRTNYHNNSNIIDVHTLTYLHTFYKKDKKKGGPSQSVKKDTHSYSSER